MINLLNPYCGFEGRYKDALLCSKKALKCPYIFTFVA
jgi:hypothetical protein